MNVTAMGRGNAGSGATRAGSDKAAPCTMVIFGASGDLTARKLIPGLYELYRRGLLPDRFAVLGAGRTAMSDEQFRNAMGRRWRKTPAVIGRARTSTGFSRRCTTSNSTPPPRRRTGSWASG